jgi:hypothetical protein
MSLYVFFSHFSFFWRFCLWSKMSSYAYDWNLCIRLEFIYKKTLFCTTIRLEFLHRTFPSLFLFLVSLSPLTLLLLSSKKDRHDIVKNRENKKVTKIQLAFLCFFVPVNYPVFLSLWMLYVLSLFFLSFVAFACDSLVLRLSYYVASCLVIAMFCRWSLVYWSLVFISPTCPFWSTFVLACLWTWSRPWSLSCLREVWPSLFLYFLQSWYGLLSCLSVYLLHAVFTAGEQTDR